MKLLFVQPSPGLGAGGLDAAIRNLSAALSAAGNCRVDSMDRAGSWQADVVHFHGLWQPWHRAISRECLSRGIPYVISPHGMLEPWAWRHKWWKKWPYYWTCERGHLRSAAGMFATSAMESAHLKRFAGAVPVEAIPLGLTGDAGPDYDRARSVLGWSSEGTVLLYLSRIHPKKGMHLLLEALRGPGPGKISRLVVVGGGEDAYVRRLRDYARDHSADLPPIEWIGEVWGEDRWKYFQGADLFCLPTFSENFGLAVLEALQVGTPVLTTTGTPWAELLPGDGGRVVNPDPESLRNGLVAMLSVQTRDPGHRRALAEKTHGEFGWSRLAERYLAAYRTLAGKKPGSGT